MVDVPTTWKTPLPTPPLTDEQRGAWFDAESVKWFVELNEELEFALPLEEFVVGASRRCELARPGSGMSAEHCRFVRRGSRLIGTDTSTNGTFVRNVRVDGAFTVEPGDVIETAPVKWLALTDAMREQRAPIGEILGRQFSQSADNVLRLSQTDEHVLLVGEQGSDLIRLARAIHAASKRASSAPVELAALARKEWIEALRSSRSTIIVDLEVLRRLDPSFASMMLSGSYHVRVIALATTEASARLSLSKEVVEQMETIWVRPLALRAQDLPALVAAFLERSKAPFQLADLTSHNRDALLKSEWPGNFGVLRIAAERLAVIARIEGWEARANELGIAKQELVEWFAELGLAMPLFE